MARSGLDSITRIANQLPQQLKYAEQRAVRKTALVVTRGIRAEVTTASGGDNRLSGVGRRGARVGAKYDIYADGSFAVIRAKGPMHLIERKTSPHTITPRKRRGRKKGALKFPDGGFAAKARHPGTRGKKPFEKGYLRTRDQAGQIFDVEIQKAVRKVL